ncbi:probable serine/threonine-protein kinase DDB_G0282963 [Condylostylus longicornis]|uniref:probable serine/threonine-protein kinase DDB_G0282963 n=1 Tax=Condylostylus longicornis TaxID=2530218 RepID=UPI00244E259C|nr:probable serine/threonine-protein kinase DDB_G0282963 [Condylostylus longicornis]
MLHYSYKYVISSIFTYSCVPVLVAKITNCDEGHLCSSNRECCSQGCCPTQPRVATDHVLNLFFINHWYFWCVVVAILLSILCAYSLWKKRRQFCGWRSSDHHTQSEGDSAGSCYAPPQYSRCSSFHHPPPPYTEVTSKPDLYPLVFTCNSENGKNGTSYLMVQYFRNYIVRPVGSISATSTIDSLSSSFICNANEANTLVPPPYSRATSPETAINSHFQQHFMIPRSASQTALSSDNSHLNKIISNLINTENTVNNINNGNNTKCETKITNNITQTGINNEDQSLVLRENSLEEINSQQFCNILMSNPCYSDIFAANNFKQTKGAVMKNNFTNEHPSNNMNFSGRKNNSTSQFLNSNNPIYNSCGSVGGISITVPVTRENSNDYRNSDVFRRSLETCCQILQQQHFPPQNFTNDANLSLLNDDGRKNGLPSNYLSSTTCSVVSSLANIDTPSSPPQAISPTGDEVRDVLESIRQLEIDDISINDLKIEPKNSIKKRPSALSSRTKISRQNKSVYIPIWNPNMRSIKSPVNGNNFFRGRRHWISKSAPTTPGTSLPQELIDNLDQSPLLQQHEEENE